MNLALESELIEYWQACVNGLCHWDDLGRQLFAEAVRARLVGALEAGEELLILGLIAREFGDVKFEV